MNNAVMRWQQRFDNFRRALRQLADAVTLLRSRPLSELERQGLIQAFEFTHELAWNVLKDYLEYEGIQGLVGSRSTVREAFKRGLIEDGELWLDIPPRQNRCRPHRTLNLGAMMEEQVGQIRTSIQGPCCGAVAAA